MRKRANILWVVIRKEFYQIRQDRRLLILALVSPVLQVFLLGYTATTDIKTTDLVVCDIDKTVASREFVNRFTTSNYFVERFTVDLQEDLDRLIEEGKAVAGLVVPAGFGNSVSTGQASRVQMVIDGTDAYTANVLLLYAEQIVGQYSQSVITERAIAGKGANGRTIIAEPRVWYNPDLASSNFMVPGLVALVLMITTMTSTSLSIVKERENGTLEQLLVSPLKPYQLIIGKLMPFVLIGVIDVVNVLAIAKLWFGVPFRGSLVLFFGLSGLFILSTLGLGLFISTIAKTQQQAMLISQLFFILPFVHLSGFTFPIANMPDVIQSITYVIPLRYFLEIVRALFLKGSGIRELWPQASALLAFGGVILTVSLVRFRRRLE